MEMIVAIGVTTSTAYLLPDGNAMKTTCSGVEGRGLICGFKISISVRINLYMYA